VHSRTMARSKQPPGGGTPDPPSEMDLLRSGIREIVHDLSNPLGILRMAAYYLQTVKPDGGKRDEYYRIISETVDRMDAGLKRLRSLGTGESQPGVTVRKEEG
jgi:nitrogen-specific signal transduction histidine kinase